MSEVTNVQTYLAAQNLVDGATGWPSVRHQLTDAKGDKLVVIQADGGGAPEIGAAAGLGSGAFRDPAVLLLVRGEPHKGDQSEAKAQAIYDALHGKLATQLGSVTYDRVVAQTSGPIFVGQDEKQRPMHTISFRLARTQGAPA